MKSCPLFVIGEFEAFLRCGILAHGLVRVRCDDCGASRAVAFSCKRRGFCPSCLGRRMAETSAFCVDQVFPHVPVRQYVLSVPRPLRFRMAYSPEITSSVLAGFVASINADLRRRARKRGLAGPLQTGCVSVVQRFGSALNLNVHFHTLALDGVYQALPDGRLVFHPLPAPTDEDVARIARAVCRKVVCRLGRRGSDDEMPDPILANLAHASASPARPPSPSIQRQPIPRRTGRWITRLRESQHQELRTAAARVPTVRVGPGSQATSERFVTITGKRMPRRRLGLIATRSPPLWSGGRTSGANSHRAQSGAVRCKYGGKDVDRSASCRGALPPGC